ncbi:MAG: hypothetical protein JXB13_17935 [Phycisphaerae bacterium]|nr:hypothetical protein [Phycisphaerae bacterium]
MSIVLSILGILAVLIVAFIVWRLVVTALGQRRLMSRVLEQIAPIIDAVRAGSEPDAEQVRQSAANPATRKVLYDTLLFHQRLDLFPAAYRTWEAMAEADLVFWLCHPNELGSPPDAIELMETVPDPAGTGGSPRTYFVFRFKTHPPHWAAPEGWLAGVAGPFATAGDPKPGGTGTFSRFESYDSHSPEEHVARCPRPASETRA